MAYFDDIRLAGDAQDKLLQEIMASRQQAQATQPDPAVVNQMATELAAAQQPQPVAAAQPQAQVQLPAPENGLAGTAAQFVPLDTMGRIVGRQIYDLKGGYDEAAKSGDMEAAKRFADAANNIRNYGQQYGLDVSRFGSDVTRDQLGTLLQADAAKGIQDMQDMKTSREYFYEAKQRYLDQGVSDERATQMAIDDTRRYEGEYARKMASAMINYGVNDQSEMNRYAPFFAQMLYNNNPQNMAVLDAYQVNPHEQWKYNKGLEAAGFMNGLQQANAAQNFGYTRQLKQDDYAFRDAQGDKDRAFKANYAAQQQGFKKDFARFVAGLDIDKREALIQLAAKYDMDPADIFGKGGGSKSGGGQSKAEATTLQQLENVIDQALQAVENGTIRAEDGEAVENARALMEKLYSEGKIDKDTYTVAYDRINKLLKARDNKWKKYNYADQIPSK